MSGSGPMTRHAPFEAIVADMDGVLTRTAMLHERAWKSMFDGYLNERGNRTGQNYASFSSMDYRAYVDGKPRYDGVTDFLASRGIDLPYGEPSDDPAKETVCGLGNRKNAIFLELIETEGVEVFSDAVDSLVRWRRGGLKIAIVSSSRNCRRVLESADLTRRADVIVDGQVAQELQIHGKREILLEAAGRLGIEPADAVVLEDSTAGVRAARQAGFGLVAGVSRNGDHSYLTEAGAHEIVHNVYRLRFPRRIPSVLAQFEDFSRWRNGRSLAVFLDFDGTLAPIVEDPNAAQMPDETRSVLKALAECCPVSIISGRDRADVQARVRIDGLIYAGNHGFDIQGRGYERTLPEAEETKSDLHFAQQELSRHLGRLSGVIIEPKRFSVAVHYRQVRSDSVVDEVARTVETVREKTSLRKRTGKKVFELEPAVDWDKGHALKWLMDVMQIDAGRSFTVYIGDDETDEDAFAVLEGRGPGIRVGDEVSTSLADYRLADPRDVQKLLKRFAGLF